MTDESLHVYDLPQIYQKPSFQALLDALNLLAIHYDTFDPINAGITSKQQVDPSGVPGYLTNIVSSSLTWLQDDEAREQIWSMASACLSERSGRTAMPAITRSFAIADDLTVTLHEPSLTGDDLGLKTWTSSLLMSKHLRGWRQQLPNGDLRVLELGAGTGLVGISAACLWQASVTLTDLPAIVPNLKSNLKLNQEIVQKHGGTVCANALDWSDATLAPSGSDTKYHCILAADPIYSSNHPSMLVETISRRLARSKTVRIMIELPLREHYVEERDNLRVLLRKASFQLIDEGSEVGFDDWYDTNGIRAEVKCWWSIWAPLQ